MDTIFSDDDLTFQEILINEFEFLENFDLSEDTSANGMIFNGIYVPEEILSLIISLIPPPDILQLSLVCKYWCNLIKSESFWKRLFDKKHKSETKNLPWYVYYCYLTTDNFINLLKNGNGELKFEHWNVVRSFDNGFKIENPPQVSDPLPKGIPEFNGKTSCFSTSHFECVKYQVLNIKIYRFI